MTTPPADAARPVPADVLEKCARLLGPRWSVVHVYEGEDVLCCDDIAGQPVSRTSGDILLAILNKAAEMGYCTSLTIYDQHRSEAAMVNGDGALGEYNAGTPLSSLIYAFAALEPPHD